MKVFIKFLLIFILVACSQFEETSELAIVDADDDRSSFPGKFSLAGDDEFINQIKGLCLTTESVKQTELLNQALGCVYAGELKRSYFLYKLQLANVEAVKTKKAMVLNNMGVIQMNWGHRDLAESLFSESVEASRNVLNTFNLLKLQVENGTFTDESLIPFIENANLQGDDLDLLKAKISVIMRKNETAIQNYDSVVEKEAEILNFLYFLSNIQSEIKFKEVAQRYESEVGDNPSYLILNRKMNQQ